MASRCRRFASRYWRMAGVGARTSEALSVVGGVTGQWEEPGDPAAAGWPGCGGRWIVRV